MRINRENIKWIFILISTIILITWTTYSSINNRNHIRDNYNIAKGKVINFFKVGVHNTKYITYIYTVNNTQYKREINLSDEILDFFNENNPSSYNTYCFWVIYDPKNPGNSLINLESTCSCDSSIIPFSDEVLKHFY